jgi:heat shock protein HslJ
VSRTTTLFTGVAATLVLPLALVGCSSDSDPGNPTASSPAAVSPGNALAPLPTGGAELADTQWALSGASYTNTSLTDTGITLDFASADASGNAGVNTYNAAYTSAADGSVAFSEIATTQMAGDEAAMKAEADYLAALATVTGYSIAGDLLDLFAGPDQVLTFTQR